MKSLRYILAMAAMSLFTVACVQETPYEKGEPDADGCYGVYFPAQESAFVVDPASEPVQTLVAKRTNSTGEITVPVEITTNVEGVLEIAPITFADGQDETTFTVSYATAEPGTSYTASITVKDPQYASKYNDNPISIDFSVIKEKWISLGKATYIDTWTFLNEYQAELMQNELKPYMFRLMDPMSEGLEKEGIKGTENYVAGPSSMLEFEIIQVPYVFYPGKEYEFTVKTAGLVYFKPFRTGYYYPNYASEEMYLHASVIASDETGCSYNKVLGYQDNGLPTAVQLAPFVNLPDYGTGGSGWDKTAVDGFITIVFPGAVLVDYSLEVTADYAVEGVTPVEFEAGADVAKISYVVLEGEANPIVKDETVAALAAGKAENAQTITAEEMYEDEDSGMLYAYADVTCPATGKYTLVAVAFDAEGVAQTGASEVFDYVASSDDTYDVTFNVEVSDTPARFTEDGYTVYNSFAFTVYGGNKLTDVKIGVYSTSDVEKYGMDVIVSDLRYEDEKTNASVSADTLAMINTTAGFTDLYTGLKDGTSYTLVVWGTNGMQTAVVAEEYTTEKNPEVFKSIGKAKFTDALISAWYGAPAVEYEVEIEESQDNPGKYRLVNPYGEVYPYNEPGDWDDSKDYYLVIDATDPEYVNVLESDLGVDWGSGMMWTMSAGDYFVATGQATLEQVKAAGYYGKLADGVITFGEGTILIADDKQAATGTIKVILPAATADGDGDKAEAASASKPSAKVSDASFNFSKSKGFKADAGFERETRTVAVTATVTAKQPTKTSIDRSSAPTSLTTRNF